MDARIKEREPFLITLGLSAFLHSLLFLGWFKANFSEFDGQPARIDIINVNLLDNFAIPQDGLMAKECAAPAAVAEKEKEKIEESDVKVAPASIVEVCQKNLVPAVEASPVALRSEVLLRYRENYRGEILKKISQVKFYPWLARQKGEEGQVTVEFTLRDDGYLRGPVVIKKQCGYDSLNLAALKTIEKANPFPPFPDNLRGECISFNLDINFCLTEVSSFSSKP